MLVDGEAVLLDINKTPTMGSSSDEPDPNIANVAQGIHSYFESTA